MADIAALGLEVRSRGLKQGIDRLRNLEQQGGRTERSVKGMGGAVQKTDRQLDAMSGTANRAKAAMGALAGVLSVREVIRFSDAWNNAANQLRQVTDSTAELTGVQQALVDVSKDTRSNFQSTANLYARLARSTTELGLTQQDLLGLTTTINQSFAASGATAEEASAAITQLSQGLAAGALRGDEFNSVSEQAPGIMRAIMASLNLTKGELRDFAATGGITADIVVTALQDASDTIANDFGKTVATFGQDMETARTNLIQWVGTSEEVQSVTAALGDTMIYLSENIDDIVKVAQAAAAIYAGRLVYSMTAAAGAMGTATTAAAALRVAIASLSTAGVLGILVGAGGLLYTFREELGLIAKPALSAAGAVDELSLRVDGAADSMLKFEVAAFTAELVSLEAAAKQAEDNIARLQNTMAEPTSFGQGQQGDLRSGLDRQEAQLESINNQIAAREQAVDKLNSRLAQLNDTQDDNNNGNRTLTIVTDDNAKSLSEAAREAAEFSNNLQSLQDRLYPVAAASRQYQEEQALLTQGFMAGKLSIMEYLDALARLEEAQLSQQTAGQAYSGIGFGSQIGGPGTGNPTEGAGGGPGVEQDPFSKWLTQAETAFTNFDQMQADAAQSFTSEFGRAFESIIMQSQTAEEAFRQMGSALLSSVVTAIGEMIAQWLVAQAVQITMGQTGAAAALTAASATAPAVAALWAPAAAAVSLASFGANSVPAMAGIAAVNAASAAASQAGGLFASSYGSSQGGSGFAGAFDKGGNIPSGQWGIAGEYGPEIIKGPAQVTSRRDTAAMMGGQGVTVNVNNAPPGTEVREREMNGKQFIDVFVADVTSNGRSAKAMQSAFGLQRQGR